MEEQKIVKLTGEPVSREMSDILERLARDKNVTLEEINSTREMQAARSRIAQSASTFLLDNREGIRNDAVEYLLSLGAAEADENGNILVDENGDTVYNKNVERGSRLDIVIGLPASGKSSAIVDTLSAEFHSRVIDNDEAKKRIPEYDDGWGAGVVHEESQAISEEVFKEALAGGENIVLPKVGSKAEKLLKYYIEPAKEARYEVKLHFVDLSRNKALGRMLERFIEKGRFLDPELIDKYAPLNEKNRIEQCYEALKDSTLIGGYSKWDNDVGRGERPILTEHKNLTGNYIDHARTQKGGNDYEMETQHDTGRGTEVEAGARGRDGREEYLSDTVGEKTQRGSGKTFEDGKTKNSSGGLSHRSGDTGRRTVPTDGGADVRTPGKPSICGRTVPNDERAAVRPDKKPSLCEKLHRKNAEVVPPKRNSQNREQDENGKGASAGNKHGANNNDTNSL